MLLSNTDVSGGGSNGSVAPSFDLEKLALEAIANGISLNDFDSYDLFDLPLLFKGLNKRYQLQQEGIVANIIRMGFVSLYNANPFQKKKIKDLKDFFRFTHEVKEGPKDRAKEFEIFAKLYWSKVKDKTS